MIKLLLSRIELLHKRFGGRFRFVPFFFNIKLKKKIWW